MRLSLYEIEVSQLQLVEQLIELGGEITPEMEEALALNKENLETKGTNYGLIIKQIESECDIIDNEIERLSKLKKARNNSIERLKNNLSTAMQIFGVLEIKSPILKINFRKSESIEIEDMKLLDSGFIKTTVSQTADKTAIKEAIKAGNVVQGAILKQNQNLQIK